MPSPCVGCSDCTLYPDGAMRCDINMRLAVGGCPNIKPGHLKIFKPEMKEKVRRIIKEQQEPSKTREKIRGSPVKKRVAQEQGKLL